MPAAIHTRYIPATDRKPARVKAICRRAHGGVLTCTITYSYSGREHQEAAEALRDTYFPGLPLMLIGQTLDGRGDVFSVNPINV